MRPITIHVGVITFHSDLASTLASLAARLKELGIPVADRGSGELLARCITLPLNMIVWRCWSEKLIFRAKKFTEDETRVEVYAIPNFFRLGVPKNEAVIDIHKLLSQLR